MQKLITRIFSSIKSLAVLVLLLSSLSLLRAQDQASITGVVSDPSGAVVPGVDVMLSNSATGVKLTQTTDNLGSYRFPNVPPNSGYTVTFTHPGFAIAVVSDIPLSVGITRTQNVRLAVGGESQTVAVSAGNETVTLDTTDATIGNNLDVNQLQDLPVYDRAVGISTLFFAQSGVDSNQGAVTGARIDQSEVTVDGLDVNDIAAGTTFGIVGQAPVDSVQQFTGSVAGLTAGIGTGSGAQFELVTKNGTNQFHGNVNEYHRDTTTEANTWFNNLDGLPRTPLIRNQFGGDIGGPIKRDKLFFYFDLVDSRIVQSKTVERTVPLPAFRNGTLNYINSDPGCDDNSRINTQPGCITTLSASQVAALDPAGIGFDASELSFITGRYPDGPYDYSQGDGVNTAGFRFNYPSPDNRLIYVGRVDYNLTPTQKIFGRFTIDRRTETYSAPQFPTDPLTHPEYDHSYGYVASHTWDIGKNKVNEFYYGDNISKFAWPDLYNPTGVNQYSFSGLSSPYTSYDGQQRRVPIPVVRDDFNWLVGNHSLTFGGTFKFIKTNSHLVNNFNFPGIGLTGPEFASGLDANVRPSDINMGPNNVGINDYDNLFAASLGVIGEVATNYVYNNKEVAQPEGTGSPRAYRYFQTEAYFGDTWKINAKLTISYGVRYQLYSVPYEAKGSESVPTPIELGTFINDREQYYKTGNPTNSNTGLPIYSYVLGGKANHGPNIYQPNYKDFAPRFAFAYAPYSDGKTVINGGAGIVYDRTVINAINFLQDQVPNIFANQTTNNIGSSSIDLSLKTDPRVGADLAYPTSLNPLPLPSATPYIPYVDSTGTPYGLAAGETGFEIDPHLKDPYSIAMNLGVQQELPGHMVLKINYVGRLGRRLNADADASQVLDVPDYTGLSTQSMANAFAGLTKDLRANAASLTPEPWFEDVMPAYGAQIGFGDNTNLVAAMVGQLGNRGDISDSLYTLAAYSYYYGFTGFLPTNIGIPSQFGTNAYFTNMGSSNYHGMLVTLDKNMSQGLRAEFNYTWSHSIDNTSVSANANALFTNSNFICDIVHPRACRGSSDFDVRQEFNGNFLYELPVGHGRTYLANIPRWADEVIGGWSISGLPYYRTGVAVSATADAYLASFDNLDFAIFTGNKADLKAAVNVNHQSNAVYTFKGGAAGAAKVLSEFRGPLGIEYGQRNLMRGPGAFFFDAGLGKKFPVFEDKVNLVFRADAYNVLNHPVFGTGGLDIVGNASQFGQISGTDSGPDGQSSRVAQFSLRAEF
jgi:hypothetical protein